jgi:hypothetical protein
MSLQMSMSSGSEDSNLQHLKAGKVRKLPLEVVYEDKVTADRLIIVSNFSNFLMDDHAWDL